MSKDVSAHVRHGREARQQSAHQFTDKRLHCVDCDQDFVWTASEQEFFKEKGFKHEPRRCQECRKGARSARGEGAPREKVSLPDHRVSYEITCAKCGKPTTVPFRPKNNRPLYCNGCFRPDDRRG
ncbi:MAG TPA: zinc-ribbon domain containing protein [Pyrinomonadaceae bacterium]|jgi:CxxC-x17-CxxC domain-containing protein